MLARPTSHQRREARLDVGAISDTVVRDALRAVRYGKGLKGSPLLQMDALALRLRAEGVVDTLQSREWEIGRFLDEICRERLVRLRSQVSADTEAADGSLARLQADFQAGLPDLEVWGLLHFRYLTAARRPLEKVASALGIVYRTLARRLDAGHALMAEALREAERKSAAAMARNPGAPVATRIVVVDAHESAPEAAAAREGRALPDAETGAGRSTFTLLAEEVIDRLLTTVKSDDRVLRLAQADIAAVLRRPIADLVDYRLGRVVEWSQPRYRLDARFVDLSLLFDQGEETETGRWLRQTQRFSGLRAVLADLSEPAIVLLGPPGSGKSTLLRQLELELAIAGLRGELPSVTFFVPLNRYKGQWPDHPPPPPRPWLAELWRTQYPALPALEALLADGRMILLLDGINEMSHAGKGDYRLRILIWKQFLHELVATSAGNRVIFSCRSLDYSAPLSTPALRVPQVQIEPMTDDQVRHFLRAYTPGAADVIWQQLEGTDQLSLVRAPYFLKLVVDQVAMANTVPKGRASLFTGFVRQALRREIERDNPLFQPDGLLTERDYQRVLHARRWRTPYELPCSGVLFPKTARLAYEMQARWATPEASQVRVDYAEAMRILGEPRGPDLLRAGEDLGIIDEDRDRDEVLFFHQLLQEYFAARRMAEDPHPELLRLEWRADRVSPSIQGVIAGLDPADPLPPLPGTGWEETVVMAAAMATDADAFVRHVAEVNLVLAGRCAAQTEVNGRLAATTLEHLRRTLVARSRDPGADLRERIAAGYALGDLGDSRFARVMGPDGAYLLPPLIDIAGGDYPIGDDEVYVYPGGSIDGHKPRHQVALAPFAVGQFPVTNAEWACFMASGGYDDARWWSTAAARAWQRGETTAAGVHANLRFWRRNFAAHPGLLDEVFNEGRINREAFETWQKRLRMGDAAFEAHLRMEHAHGCIREPRYWRDDKFNHTAQPVIGICWFEALAYCNWLSAQSGLQFRLPTEVEWEAAARGAEERMYAYGGEFDALRGNTLETHVRKTTPVGVFPNGDTPEGVADMAGNVTNWTGSLWGGEDDVAAFRYPYDAADGREDLEAEAEVQRVLRGVGWNGYRGFARAGLRFSDHPANVTYNGGARVSAHSMGTV